MPFNLSFKIIHYREMARKNMLPWMLYPLYTTKGTECKFKKENYYFFSEKLNFHT